jgi:hypothetical protein
MTVALSEQVRDTFEMVPGWSCQACTYINPNGLALACEACQTVRGTVNPNQDSPASIATQEDADNEDVVHKFDVAAVEFRPQLQDSSQDSVSPAGF